MRETPIVRRKRAPARATVPARKPFESAALKARERGVALVRRGDRGAQAWGERVLLAVRSAGLGRDREVARRHQRGARVRATALRMLGARVARRALETGLAEFVF